jgi:hypothetical protein
VPKKPRATKRRAATPEEPAPVQLTIVGKPWALIFARHPTVPSKQGIWLFNEEAGEFWELVSNNNFVLRPRQKA